MRRIERLRTYNSFVEETKLKNKRKTLNKSELEALLKISNLKPVISFNIIPECESKCIISEECYFGAFDEKDNESANSICRMYNLIKFDQYLDSNSKEHFEVGKKLELSFKELPEALNFSDISSSLKSFGAD